jgi:hypothetical protein
MEFFYLNRRFGFLNKFCEADYSLIGEDKYG